MNDQEAAELDAYIARFKDMPPEDILRLMGEMTDFLLKYMTPEGREFLERQRNIAPSTAPRGDS